MNNPLYEVGAIFKWCSLSRPGRCQLYLVVKTYELIYRGFVSDIVVIYDNYAYDRMKYIGGISMSNYKKIL